MTAQEYDALLTKQSTPFGDFAYVGVGEGPPAVFIHGLFISGYFWSDVIEQLANERRCIAYNLPGHGHSRVADDQDLSLPSQAEMLAAFCDALGLGTIDLVANDTGGAIAQAFAVRHPDRVRTLTLTNCEADDVLPSPSEIGQLVHKLAEAGELAPVLVGQLEDLNKARSEIGFGASLEHADRLPDEDIRALLGPHSSTLENARQIERWPLFLDSSQMAAIRPDLRRLEVPTLVAWGTGDHVFELKLAYWLRDTIPGCNEVIEIPDGKLFWPLERPDELVPHLRRHWATADTESARPPTAA